MASYRNSVSASERGRPVLLVLRRLLLGEIAPPERALAGSTGRFLFIIVHKLRREEESARHKFLLYLLLYPASPIKKKIKLNLSSIH